MNDTNDYLKVVKKALEYIDAQPLIEMPFDEAKEVMKLVEQAWNFKTIVCITIALDNDLITVVPRGGIHVDFDVIETANSARYFSSLETFKEDFYYPLLARKMVKNTKELIDSIPMWIKVDKLPMDTVLYCADTQYSYHFLEGEYYRYDRASTEVNKLINYNASKGYHWTEVP